jgi:FMN phosphatase YigB (HAD superfamily)
MRAVFFDIGETLINETRPWSLLADWLEVPRMTFFAVLGGFITQGRDHREIFDMLRPDIGWKGIVDGYLGRPDLGFREEDLYPDVVPCLSALKGSGYFVGIAGNQPAEAEAAVRAMNLPADLIATSAGWGVKKPDPGFFQRIVRESGFSPNDILYVGDRVDNDVVPTSACGIVSIHLVRGPWGYLQQSWPDAARAHAQIRSLEELPAVVQRLR